MFDRDLGLLLHKLKYLIGSCKLNMAINPWHRSYTRNELSAARQVSVGYAILRAHSPEASNFYVPW